MRNRVSCLFVLLVSARAFAQPGSLDQSYGVGGWAIIPSDFFMDCESRAIALAEDGSSYVVGACLSNPDIRVAHLDVNGQLDMAYGTDGIATIDIDPGMMDDPARGAAVLPDGKLLIGGSATAGPPGDLFTLVKLLPDGSLDGSFATNGVLQLNFSNQDDQANGMLILSSGKILLYGVQVGGGPNPLVVRLNADGTLDTTFNGTGSRILYAGLVAQARDAVELPDGRIVVCGESTTTAWAVRILTTGLIDPNFPLQHFSFNDGTWLEGLGIAAKADGRYVLTGQMSNGVYDLFAMGLTDTGALDNDFGIDGSFRSTAVTFAEMHDVQCSSIDGSCRIIGRAYVDDTARVVVAKINDGGQLDAAYADGGIGAYDVGGGEEAYCSVVQNDGKLLVGGQAGGMFALRLHDDLSTHVPSVAFATSGSLSLYVDADSWWLQLTESTGIARVELIDALGRTAHDQRYNSSRSRIQLPTASLAPGSYLVRATQHGRTSVGRILVNR